jgi:hypothetical protein
MGENEEEDLKKPVDEVSGASKDPVTVAQPKTEENAKPAVVNANPTMDNVKPTTDTGTSTTVTPDYSKPWEEFRKVNEGVPYSTYLSNNAKYRKENGQPQYSLYEVWNNFQADNDKEEKKEERTYKRNQFIVNLGEFLGNLVNVIRTNNGYSAFQLDMSNQRNRLYTLHDKAMQERRQRMQEQLGMWRQQLADDRQEAAEKAEREYKEKSLDFQIQKQDQAQKNWQAGYDLDVAKFGETVNQNKIKNEQTEQSMAETERHHKVDEKTQAVNAQNKGKGSGSKGGGVRESFTTQNGITYVRASRPLTEGEAYNIVNVYGTDDDREKVTPTTANPKPNVLAVAARLLAEGKVNENAIKGMGFEKAGEQAKETPTPLGWGTPQDEDDEEDNDNVTDW